MSTTIAAAIAARVTASALAVLSAHAGAAAQPPEQKNRSMGLAVAQRTVALPLGLQRGQRLVSARALMLRSGWRPVALRPPNDPSADGAEKELVERGWREVYGCSIDRGVLCILRYAKGAHCAQLYTVGETVPAMHVTGWAIRCDE